MALWTPAEITTALWLDAADSDTVTLVSGAVSEWADKSGKGYHVSQSTADKRPVVLSAEQNGKDVIYFDGSDDFMALSDAGLDIARNVAGLSIFAVCTNEGGDTAYRVTFYSNTNATAAGRAIFYQKSNLLGAGGRRLDADSWQNKEIARSGTGYALIGSIFDYGNAELYLNVNGSALEARGGFQTAGNTSDTRAHQGGVGNVAANNQRLQGSIAEIVITQSAIGVDDREKIEGYLAHKWGLEANLPGDHPYKHLAPGAITGELSASASLHGDPWLARVIAGRFGLEADIAATKFLGRFLDAGAFTGAAGLSEPSFLYGVDGHLSLAADLHADPLRAYPMPRFVLGADLETANVYYGLFQEGGRFEIGSTITGEPHFDPPPVVYGPETYLPMLTGGMSAKTTGVSIHADMPSITGSLFTGAVIADDMPMLTGEMTAQVERSGSVEAIMPMLTGQMFSGTSLVGTMPSLEGTISAQAERTASVSAAMPRMTGVIDGTTEAVGTIEGTLPLFTGNLFAQRHEAGSIAAHMPRLSGSMGVLIEETSSITGNLPMLSGGLTAGRTIPHDLTATMPALTGFLVASRPTSWGVMRYSKGAYR